MGGRRLACVVGLLVLALPAAAPAHAQAEYCSDITKNTTWGPDKTHIVGDNCTVNVRGATLTIRPDTQIQMGQSANLVFQEGGQLVAQSYVDSTTYGVVRFLANTRDDVPGYWGQIRFEPGSKTSTMTGALLTGNVILPVLVSNGGAGGVPMVDVRGGELQMDWIILQKALEEPLGFASDILGPSLEAPGQSTVGGACDRVQLQNNGVPGIVVHADAPIDISTEVTWHSFCVPYFVDDEIRIAGPEYAYLKLDADLTLRFGPQGSLVAGLDADNPGMLDVAGTAVEPVILTGREEVPGAWKGVTITAHGGASSINNAIIEYGGSDTTAMVTVDSPEATAWLVEFRRAKSHPLRIAAQAVSSFTSALAIVTGEEPQAFVDNGTQAVAVQSSDDPVLRSNSMWGDLEVPYELDGSLIVAGPIGPRLSLTAGAELRFPAGGQLIVGSASEGPGDLEVRGEEDRPVILTSIADAPGSWRGILVTNEAGKVSIDRALIENGGSGGPMVDWGRVGGDVTRVTFRSSAGYPLALPLSVANDVLLAAEVPDEVADADLRSKLEGNGTNRFLVRVDRNYTTSLSDWSDPGAPVEFDNTVVVTSPTQPLLTLNPGLRLVFRAGKSLDLGDGAGGRGSLLVAGDVDGEAVVTIGPVSAEEGWAGIRVRPASSLRSTGAFEVSGPADTAAAIDVDGAFVSLDGTRISGQGRGTGLRSRGEDSDVAIVHAVVTGLRIGVHNADGASLSVTRSVVFGNYDWGLRNDDPTLCLKTPLVYWGSALGPNDPSDAEDGCLNGGNANPDGDKVSDDVDWWPYALDTSWRPSGGLGPNPWRAFCPTVVRRN